MSRSKMKSVVNRGVLRGAFLAMAAVAALLSASVASANCANPRGRNGSPALMPFHAQPAGENSVNGSIVGMWHVTYSLSDGSFFYDALDQWRRDGTEFEIANLSPVEGDVCMGEWKKDGDTIHLRHAGWSFDPSGNSLGMFTLTEENVVKGDTYTGTFDFKQFDVSGNLAAEFTGTLVATRLVIK